MNSSRKTALAKLLDARTSRRQASRLASRRAFIAPQRILVPVDFSPRTADTLSYAYAVAKKHTAKIILLHVVEWIHYVHDFGYGPVRRQRTNHDSVAKADARLRALGRKHLDSRQSWTTIVRSGTICEQIVKAAQEMKVGMIFMSTCGPVPANLAGSENITARIIRESPCPVLTFRKPLPACGNKHKISNHTFNILADNCSEKTVQAMRFPILGAPGNRLEAWKREAL